MGGRATSITRTSGRPCDIPAAWTAGPWTTWIPFLFWRSQVPGLLERSFPRPSKPTATSAYHKTMAPRVPRPAKLRMRRKHSRSRTRSRQPALRRRLAKVGGKATPGHGHCHSHKECHQRPLSKNRSAAGATPARSGAAAIRRQNGAPGTAMAAAGKRLRVESWLYQVLDALSEKFWDGQKPNCKVLGSLVRHARASGARAVGIKQI